MNVNMRILVFKDAKYCARLTGTCTGIEDAGISLLLNFGNHLPYYTVARYILP